jgi:hypothetical protein
MKDIENVYANEKTRGILKISLILMINEWKYIYYQKKNLRLINLN